MKKFSMFLLLFFLVSFIGSTVVSLLYFDYFHQKNYDDFLQTALTVRNETFDANSLLLDVSTKVNEEDGDAMLTELSSNFGDKLVGYAQLNNCIYGGERQRIRMIPKFLLDEIYIPLTEGRMPDTTKTTADFAEVICLAGKTEIGKKIKLELQNEEETYVYNFMVVGTFSALAYPLADNRYIHNYTEIIVPPMKLSDGRDIVALPNYVYLTFAKPEDKADGEAFLKNHTEYGTMVKYTHYHKMAEDVILFNRSEMKKSLILAICISIALTIFLTVLQISIFFKMKLKTGINSIWILFAMILGSVLLSLVTGTYGIMGFIDIPSDIPLKIGLIAGIVSAVVAFTAFWIRRAKNNDNN